MTERTPEQEREIAIKRLVIAYKLLTNPTAKGKVLKQIALLKKGKTK